MKTVSRRDALGSPACLEHSEKPLNPFSFCLPEALAQAVEDGAIADHCLGDSMTSRTDG